MLSEKAFICPQCGAPVRGSGIFGLEYRSKTTIGGWPLVHIALNRRGVGLGQPIQIAKGVIAIGDVAIGLLAIGGVALGGITIGGASLGLAALGGLAIGVFIAAGGLAIGLIALGGAAVGFYAMGGAAFGKHVFSQYRHDPAAVELFSRILGDGIKRHLPPTP
ncbi:MAG: hypothetical protein D6679_14220 [Candidatus Hydrogenedentota bacterium]|nr:MAG: hypothetical protein D6679_14220 [Candidatus Hydrogenedentota bacterium]